MPQATPIKVVEPRQRALLVGVFVDGVTTKGEFEASLDELEALADTAGAVVIGRVVQKRREIDPTFYVGRGKAEQIAEECARNNIDIVIFDHELSPAQVRNLEQVVKRRVIDRTELILDIFAKRARTKQAKLQVELARLEYELPRLRHMWSHLSRTEGSPGVRGGPGEQQLELDRRRAYRRVAELQRQLSEINKRTEMRAKKRSEMFTVTLVGYTNVGKSTLMNALTKAGVYVEGRLFATLDATTRVLILKHGQKALLTDTIGFINKLPPQLIASFHATLAEVRHADLLLHVADLTHPRMEEQIKVVEQTLIDIGASGKPTIMVLNKADLLPPDVDRDALKRRFENACIVSALTGEGLEELKERVEAEYRKQRQIEIEAIFPLSCGWLIKWVYEHASVLSEEVSNGILRMSLLIEKPLAMKLSSMCNDGYNGVRLIIKDAS
ncbi:MAG: GTPase HflX [Armatimonadota bacterium]|nr:GTPase HflX [Armatimonadota bacterium]MCX7777011.1 GTPase HflX [Armatimonadota bacterium]MDW8024921.1 GTPase HflX [Armatimonadota bacterium]